jgi:hypothetical protein
MGHDPQSTLSNHDGTFHCSQKAHQPKNRFLPEEARISDNSIIYFCFGLSLQIATVQ